MSLILKGIDMSEDGGTIVLKIKGSKIYREYPRYKFQPTRVKDAEAIQIPKGHGRLIDADKIMKDLEEWKLNPNNDDEAVVFVNHFQGIIRTEPTILEAEE